MEDNYGSIGPIRRSRLKPGAQTPFNESSFIGSSSVGPSKVEYSKFSQGFLPAFKKNFEPGATSRSSQSHSVDRKNPSFIMGTPTVHPHSSQIARTILEHIDRNPPTPKDKLEELNLAIAWKNSISSSTLSLDPNGQNSLNIKGSDSHAIVSLDGQKKSVEENAGKSNSLSMAPGRENIISDVNTWKNPSRSDVFLSNKSDGVQIKSSHEVYMASRITILMTVKLNQFKSLVSSYACGYILMLQYTKSITLSYIKGLHMLLIKLIGRLLQILPPLRSSIYRSLQLQ